MNAPSHAMILAAGLGLRMRPLTLTVPKPLVPVAGRTMLDRVMDHLDTACVAHRVVNLHWLGDQIRAHLVGRAGIMFSDESDLLLETGGGVTKALPLLGQNAFFACNADVIWEDGAKPALLRLAESWDDSMDALLLLQPVERAHGYRGPGDFARSDDGRLHRRPSDSKAPLVFTGVQMLHPKLFETAPIGAFSLNLLYDKAAAEGRLKGLIHDGAWYHVGTPEDVAATEALVATPG
jgi:MurNAc alpha-1-phosphate uridylyltransferase